MSRLSNVKEKYPKLNWDVWKNADPTKNLKFLDWIGKNVDDKTCSLEQIKTLLTSFEKKKEKLSEKDISKYTSVKQLEEVLSANTSNKEEKELGVIQVGEVDGAKIVCLEGEAAVKQYCAGTKWCISNMDTFLDYSRNSNVYVITKNGIKFCVLGNSLTVLYDMKDATFTAPNDYVFKFLDIKSCDIFSKITKVCAEHSKNYNNIWKLTPNQMLTLPVMLRLATLADPTFIISKFFRNSTQGLIKLIFKYQDRKEFAPFVADLKKNRSSNIWMSELNRYAYPCDLWKHLENPPKPPTAKEIMMKKFIDKGLDLKLLLKNSTDVSTLKLLLEEIENKKTNKKTTAKKTTKKAAK